MDLSLAIRHVVPNKTHKLFHKRASAYEFQSNRSAHAAPASIRVDAQTSISVYAPPPPVPIHRESCRMAIDRLFLCHSESFKRGHKRRRPHRKSALFSNMMMPYAMGRRQELTKCIDMLSILFSKTQCKSWGVSMAMPIAHQKPSPIRAGFCNTIKRFMIQATMRISGINTPQRNPIMSQTQRNSSSRDTIFTSQMRHGSASHGFIIAVL